MTDDVSLVTRLAQVLAALSATEDSAFVRLCGAGRIMLDGDGASITLNYLAESRLTVCTTDALAATLEDAQHVLGQGPAVDAARGGVVVQGSIAEAGTESWPDLADALGRTGFTGRLIAVPLRAAGADIGILCVHRGSDAPFDEAAADLLHETLGVALLDDVDPAMLDELATGWPQQARVYQASGMVIAQLGVRPADAMALLRAHAYATARSLTDVADDVVARRLDFKNFTVKGD